MRRNLKYYIAAATIFTVVAAAVFAWWVLRSGAGWVTPDRDLYPIMGVDISAHNGEVDFEELAADSIDFVILKATEGTAFKDANFVRNYRAARGAGMKVGAYHFFRFDASGYMQALNFLHSVRGRRLDMPLVIDVEEWTNPNDRTTRTIVTELRVLIDQLEEAGYDVMLYTNKDGYDRFITGNFEGYPVWIASLTDEPTIDWRLWQYTHRGKVAGIDSRVDINTFRGSREDWDNWMNEMGVQGQ